MGRLALRLAKAEALPDWSIVVETCACRMSFCCTPTGAPVSSSLAILCGGTCETRSCQVPCAREECVEHLNPAGLRGNPAGVFLRDRSPIAAFLIPLSESGTPNSPKNEIRKNRQEMLDSAVDGFGSNTRTVRIDECRRQNRISSIWLSVASPRRALRTLFQAFSQEIVSTLHRVRRSRALPPVICLSCCSSLHAAGSGLLFSR